MAARVREMVPGLIIGGVVGLLAAAVIVWAAGLLNLPVITITADEYGTWVP